MTILFWLGVLLLWVIFSVTESEKMYADAEVTGEVKPFGFLRQIFLIPAFVYWAIVYAYFRAKANRIDKEKGE